MISNTRPFDQQAWFNLHPQSGSQLIVELDNQTGFTVSELVLAVVGKSDGRTTEYTKRWFASGPVYGEIKDKTPFLLLRAGRTRFVQPISETATNPKAFVDAYSWNVVSAKGFKR